jgi:putative colanic acid biosysnthesis UDP-glucose lipid carrier transferase
MSFNAVTNTTSRSLKTGINTWYGLFSSVLEPTIAVAVYLFLSWLHYGFVRSPDVILCIVTFSLMYPSKSPFRRHVRGWMRSVLISWALVYFLLLTLGMATRLLPMFNPIMLLEWGVVTPLAILLTHSVSPLLLKRISSLQRVRPVVIVGCTTLAERLIKNIANDETDSLKVVATFDDRNSERLEASQRVLHQGDLDAVKAYVKQHRVERILITLPMSQNPRILKLLDELRDTTASIFFVPDIFMSDLIQARMDSIGDLPVLAVCDTPFYGINAAIKRLSDILISVFCLVLFLPIMIVLALLIALSSKGPIIYRQKRYGLDGKEIVVWKFRSMKNEPAPDITIQATKDDPRITAIGRFIRKTSLDELPQFINVLQGRMSIVGPRPHAVSHNELYRSLVKGYMVRHKVKPGITGLAQVNGARGETKTVADMERRIDLDLRYLRNWSLRLDIEILFRTIKVLFHDPKAY